MILGRCDFCLNVSNFNDSYKFYKNLGFLHVEGDPKENWSVLEHNNLRMGLYLGDIKEPMMNFRGGNVEENYDKLIKLGIKFKAPLKKLPNNPATGVGSATFYDLDNNAIFLDTAESELNILKETTFNIDEFGLKNKSSLGRADVCFTVKDVKKSHEFYKKLNFIDLEGNLDEGWSIMGHTNFRIGLFSGEKPSFSINFRGADINSLYHHLASKFNLNSGVKKEDDGTLSFSIYDPDNIEIYFNT